MPMTTSLPCDIAQLQTQLAVQQRDYFFFLNLFTVTLAQKTFRLLQYLSFLFCHTFFEPG